MLSKEELFKVNNFKQREMEKFEKELDAELRKTTDVSVTLYYQEDYMKEYLKSLTKFEMGLILLISVINIALGFMDGSNTLIGGYRKYHRSSLCSNDCKRSYQLLLFWLN